MGKMKIRLYPDGTVQMETEGIKGKRCTDYAKVLEKLADLKIESVKTTSEYYEQEVLEQQTEEQIRQIDF